MYTLHNVTRHGSQDYMGAEWTSMYISQTKSHQSHQLSWGGGGRGADGADGVHGSTPPHQEREAGNKFPEAWVT